MSQIKIVDVPAPKPGQTRAASEFIARLEAHMLFARTYLGLDHETVRRQIEENMRRGYSWWFGEYDPNLPCEPGYDPALSGEENVRERMERFAAALPENIENLPTRNDFAFPVEPFPGNQRLPGLCAVCSATSYQELAQRIWEDFDNRNGWIGGRLPVIAIFNGEPVGADPERWPLFTASKLLAIADITAIARPGSLGPERHVQQIICDA